MGNSELTWFLCILALSLISLSYASSIPTPLDEDHPRHIDTHTHTHPDRLKRSPQPHPEDENTDLDPSTSSSSEEESSNFTTHGKLHLPEGYNKLAIPAEKGNSVYVYVSLFVRQVQEIDEKNEQLSLDVDLGMRWVDWKIYNYLSSTNFTDPETNKTIGNRTLDSEVLKEIWKPDIFIDELAGVEKSAIFSKLVTLNFLGKTNDMAAGDIVLSARMTLKLQCDMEFEYYPADTQECKYVIRSYSYPSEKLELRWNPFRPVYLDEPHDPNFDLQISSAEPNEKMKLMFVEEKFNQYRSANYSALEFTIKARRNLKYHLVQTYLPSVLLIFITWLCFFIPWSMVEARIGISMTTLLTLTAMFAAVRQQSPEVSYTMAIDTWMVFCIFSVFIALLMFTSIYWLKLRMTKSLEEQEEKKNGKLDNASHSTNDIPDEMGCKGFVIWTKKWAFWTFAFVSLLFFVVYWVWLLSASGYFQWTPHPDYNFALDADEDDPGNLYRYHYKSIDSYEEEVNGLISGETEEVSSEVDRLVETFLNTTGDQVNNDTIEVTTLAT